MQDKEKRVIVFIAEGLSDELALGTIMTEYFSNESVRFVVVHGDITTQDYSSVDNIVKKINDVVGTLKLKYRYKTSNLLKIIHLTDTDGTFVKEEAVVSKDIDSIMYYEDHMETGRVNETIKRNEKKSSILFKLRKTGKIGSVPYRLYYNSCNLEHVLYEELKEFTDEEKEEMADEFAERYEGKVEEFISFISDKRVATDGTYQETWNFIEKELHSLQRHSNMHQIFQ